MRVDPFSLGAGVVIAALGTLILLDTTDALDLTLGWIAVALTAAVGAILLLSGIAPRRPSRHD
jgi:hypothetical protein